tara:strand:+ start:424 stop:1080 length:657 start_codon:yes stop_codon:yes gene_type:complete
MLEKILTEDGSYSFYNSVLNETYHSKKGALTESQYVYILKGLDFMIKNKPNMKELKVFEMGFGTGLNAVLAKRFAELNQVKLSYTSIDKYPLTDHEINSVKLKTLSKNELNILHSDWGKTIQISLFFNLCKIKDDFLNTNYINSFDIIFYDAFAYHAQPMMWSKSILKKSTDLLKKDGIWVSYCSKGRVRRIMENIGHTVKKIPGPPGKREMLRVTKN